MEIIALPRIDFLGGVFLANHVENTDNQNNQETEHIKKYKRKLTLTQKVAQ